MANIRMTVCDVQALKGDATVPATKKVKFTIPAIANETGFAIRAEIDVSDAGDKEVKKRLAAAQEATFKAYESLMELVPAAQLKAAETTTARKRKSAAPAAAPVSELSGHVPAGHGQDQEQGHGQERQSA